MRARVGMLSSPPEGRRAVLKRVGIVLMVVGLLDIAYRVYCVANGISCSSSLNVFALIAGVFLYRGSLTAARIGAHAAAFLLGGVLVGLLALPFLCPTGLILVAFKTAPASTLLAWVLSFALPVLSFWVYRQLTAEAVQGALNRPLAGKRSLIAGALLVLLVVLLVSRSLLGSASDQVVAEARQKLGPDYEYFVARMTRTTHRDGESSRALVLAYNSERLEPVQVMCKTRGTSSRCVSRWEGSSGNDARSGEAVSEADLAQELEDHLALGHERFRKRDFRAAIAEYGAAIQRDPSSFEAYYWRGVAHLRSGEKDLAWSDFNVCIERGDPNINVYVQADRLLMQSGEWTRIIDMWTTFIGRNPTSGRAYYERGGAHYRNGDRERALRDAEASCKLGEQAGCRVLQRLSRHD